MSFISVIGNHFIHWGCLFHWSGTEIRISICFNLGVSRDRATRPGYRAIFNSLNTEASLLFTTDSVSAHKSRYIMYYSHVRVTPGRARAGPSTFTSVGVTFWHSGPRFRLFTMIWPGKPSQNPARNHFAWANYAWIGIFVCAVLVGHGGLGH